MCSTDVVWRAVILPKRRPDLTRCLTTKCRVPATSDEFSQRRALRRFFGTGLAGSHVMDEQRRQTAEVRFINRTKKKIETI